MFSKYKTYKVAIITVIGAIVAYLLGEVELIPTLQIIVGAIFASTIRHGVTTEAAKKLALGALCVVTMTAFMPRNAEAFPPLAYFAGTVIVGLAVGVTNEECKADGLDIEDCAKRTWAEREASPADYAGLNE